MRLTGFTDLGLRALMRIAGEPGRAFSAGEIAAEFDVSRDHLAKAMAALGRAGILATRRGGGGGAVLARPASTIRLGEVVRVLERDQPLVECFRADGGTCAITARCRLRARFAQAERAFLAELDGSTLADCALERPVS